MAKTKARFIEPMLLMRTEKLPQGPDWLYEIKLDGYRILAIKTEGKVQLRSRSELNRIRLQTNSQPSLEIDDWMLPQEFCLHTGSVPHRLLKEMLEHLPYGLKGEFLQAMINTQPNTQLVRDALLRGETVAGAKLERRSHIRID